MKHNVTVLDVIAALSCAVLAGIFITTLAAVLTGRERRRP